MKPRLKTEPVDKVSGCDFCGKNKRALRMYLRDGWAGDCGFYIDCKLVHACGSCLEQNKGLFPIRKAESVKMYEKVCKFLNN